MDIKAKITEIVDKIKNDPSLKEDFSKDPEKTIENLVECLKLISDDTFRDLFTRAAKRGYGIELNFSSRHPEEIMEQILRPYRIAKECGCKF